MNSNIENNFIILKTNDYWSKNIHIFPDLGYTYRYNIIILCYVRGVCATLNTYVQIYFSLEGAQQSLFLIQNKIILYITCVKQH